jgi:hypothetical protein
MEVEWSGSGARAQRVEVTGRITSEENRSHLQILD